MSAAITIPMEAVSGGKTALFVEGTPKTSLDTITQTQYFYGTNLRLISCGVDSPTAEITTK